MSDLRLRWRTAGHDEWGHATAWQADIAGHHLLVQRLDAEAFRWHRAVQNIIEDKGARFAKSLAQADAEGSALQAIKDTQDNLRAVIDAVRPIIEAEDKLR